MIVWCFKNKIFNNDLFKLRFSTSVTNVTLSAALDTIFSQLPVSEARHLFRSCIKLTTSGNTYKYFRTDGTYFEFINLQLNQDANFLVRHIHIRRSGSAIGECILYPTINAYQDFSSADIGTAKFELYY